MRELNIEEIQKVELNILIKFDEICRTIGVRYFIYYGTLLGAVRHGGFIPWDDDADVIMPRPDFEIFIRYCEEHKDELKPFFLIYYTTNNRYIYPIGRLCDARYTVNYVGNDDYGLGLFIDIYPYDGVGDTYKEAEKNIKKLKIIRHFLQLAGTNYVYKSRYGAIITLLKRLLWPCVKVIGIERFIKIEMHVIKKYSYETSKYVANALWNGYGTREIGERDLFTKIISLKFSGYEFYAPENYDEHLKRLYGNYMELPSEEQQHPTHNYKAYYKGDNAI